MLKPSLDDLIKSAIRSILKNKGRTVLTSLGIIIGVTSVILLTSIGNGLKGYINEQFDKLGSNMVYISPGKIFNDQGGFASNDTIPSKFFNNSDLRALKRDLSGMAAVYPANELKSKVIYGKSEETGNLLGTTWEWGEYGNSNPPSGKGRFITAEDDQKNSRVTVLGFEIAKELFPSRNPVGREVEIEGKSFEVIGVVDEKGSTMGGPSLDRYIYIPISTYRDITANDDIMSISIKVFNPDNIDKAKRIATRTLLEEYDDDEFTVFDSAQLLNSINSIIGMLTIGLTGIAAISLVVGGIGIMNIMLVTVSERTREIGLRKAIGAYPRAILIQFLIEAVILSCLGGAFGILLGYLGSLAINNFFPAQVTLSSVAIAFGVSTAVGVIFGVAPAHKASKLSPIEALRYE
jgi:putative ABC transport system permease protein